MNRVVCFSFAYSGDYGGAVGTYMCDCKTINCIMRCKNMNLLGSGLRGVLTVSSSAYGDSKNNL